MGGLKTFWSRVVALFWRRELDRDLEDELRSHIEIASEENRRSGMPDEKARQKAMRDFGGLTQVRETVRTGEGLTFSDAEAAAAPGALHFVPIQYKESECAS